MNATTTEFLEHFSSHQPFLHRKRVIDYPPMHAIRESVWGMLRSIHGIETETALRLRRDLLWGLARLHYCITNPVDQRLAMTLLDLTESERRFGEGFRRYHDRALQCLDEMDSTSGDFPAAKWFMSIVNECKNSGSTFRILSPKHCHKGFVDILRDLNIEPEGLLLHTPAGYRSTPLFDLMIRVGPMRTEGIGAIPDGILTAPRYARLEQMVWNGVSDEPDVGFDAFGEWREDAANNIREFVPHGIRWKWEESRQLIHVPVQRQDELGASEPPELFELESERLVNKEGELVSAVAITVASGLAMFLRQRAKVACFRLTQPPTVLTCLAAEVKEGDFLIVERLDQCSFSNPGGRRFPYAAIWKARLREKLERDAESLKAELRKRGVSVLNLDSALQEWSESPNDFLHAPRKRRDRQLLLRVLGLEKQMGQEWVIGALAEIAEYRGERVSEGSAASEKISAEIRSRLEERVEEIRRWVEEEPDLASYSIMLHGDEGISGHVGLHRIIAVEGASTESDIHEEHRIVQVPERRLGMWVEPDEVDMWRLNYT